MPYEAKAIANYFLDLAKEKHETINPMKIQKLVYFSHAWYLAIYKKPLLNEPVEAWIYGPVIPSLYHAFKRFGDGPIREKATSLEFRDDQADIVELTPTVQDEAVRNVIANVWEVYGDYSAVQLSNFTHKPGSPWDEVYSKNEGRRSVAIPDEIIRASFESVAAV